MDSQIREELAAVAGRLITGETAADQGMNRSTGSLKLSPFSGNANCGSKHGPDGINYCLIDKKSGQHICLSIYGKVFDGYDHGSASLFTGFVAKNTVSLYDYKEAYYFNYRLQQLPQS